MNISKVAVLTTHAAVIRKHKGNWSYTSQSKVLKLLKQYHRIEIHRRMLCYHLADLREGGLIKTIKRTRRLKDGTLTLLSSATALTIKGCLLLYRLGNRWALKQLHYLKKRYLPSQDKPQSQGSPPQGIRYSEQQPKASRFLDPGFRIALGLEPFPPFKV